MNRLKQFILRYFYKSIYRPGHYYSTIPDVNEIMANEAVIFTKDKNICDINLNQEVQLKLSNQFVKHKDTFDYPEISNHNNRFYKENGFFIESDAFFLHCFIHHFQPKTIIEVGSGFTSALMLDVNEKTFNNTIDLKFIEPFPERLYSLLSDSDDKGNVLVKKVQDVPISFFEVLDQNDILFIDSSHVSKIGSDLNYILFEVLPKLKPGVIIHFHDITWPFEYPKTWIEDGIFWNEIYLLRAFLMNNSDYEILLFNNYLCNQHRKWIKENLPNCVIPGGSFYIRKLR